MRLEDVFLQLPELYNKRFGQLKLQEDISSFTINKGNTGQFLQQLLDMPNNSNLTDFVDGELKTNKSHPSGMPRETMFITQISKDFDNLFLAESKTNRLLEKISNLLYLPVVKPNSDLPEEWYFLPAHHINSEKNQELKDMYLQDFITIKEQILEQLNDPKDGNIHTTSGKYIQIRSKDSKRKDGTYNPIYSEVLGRNVSNKNHAFYFKTEFMKDIQNSVIYSKIID